MQAPPPTDPLYDASHPDESTKVPCSLKNGKNQIIIFHMFSTIFSALKGVFFSSGSGENVRKMLFFPILPVERKYTVPPLISEFLIYKFDQI